MAPGYKKDCGRILVVDDDENLRDLIVRTLAKAGYEAEGAADGAGVLARMGASPSGTGQPEAHLPAAHLPTVMLLDQNLPDMTGLQVLAALAERGVSVPFIVMTGQGDERLAVELMKLGAFDYLVKDTDFLDLLPLALERLCGTLEMKRELREAESKFRESEKKYRFLVEHSYDLIGMLKADGVIAFASPSWKTGLGYDPSFLEGQDFRLFVHPDDLAACGLYVKQVHDARKALQGPQYRIKHAEGAWRWHEATLTPVMDDSGSLLHYVGVSRDITERKLAEEALARQLAEKETLLREVHHRVKNNIASIGSLLSLQAASAVGEEARTTLEAALARVQSMGVLYDRLLLSGEYQGIGMKDYMEGLIDSILEIIPKDPAITLDTRIDDFTLDPKKAVSVGIILNELLTNALKYAFVGRQRGRILVSLTKQAQQAELVVQDDGIGLPAAIDRAAHDPLHAPRPVQQSASGSGSGFGLTLVSMLAEQLGGSLAMESGAGTTSTLKFVS